MHCAYLSACSWPVAGAVLLPGDELQAASRIRAPSRIIRYRVGDAIMGLANTFGCEEAVREFPHSVLTL
jgi:hypothetical protein